MSTSFEVTPVNNQCQNITNKNVIVSTPGTPASQTSSSINNLQQQHKENSQFDNIGDAQIKPLHGGYISKKNIKSKKNKINNNKFFVVIFNNQQNVIESNSKKNALNKFLKLYKIMNSYDKLSFIEIYEKNNKSNNLLYFLI